MTFNQTSHSQLKQSQLNQSQLNQTKSKPLKMLCFSLLLSFSCLSSASSLAADATVKKAPSDPLALTQTGDRNVGHNFVGRSQVIAQNGMVATSVPLATQIGLDILKQGGNALDAAIAANAALGLMEPTGNGIGGDLFAIVWDPKTEQLYGLNGSGRSPQGLSLTQLKKELKKRKLDQIPAFGALPVSVPGTVDAWFELHNKFGQMPMSQILKPSIDYANNGFPMSQLIAYYMGVAGKRYLNPESMVEETKNFLATYYPNGKAPVEGQIFKNPDLANTLTKIAKGGREVFYQGEIAKTMDAYMKRIGGFLRYQDFASHKSEWVKPWSINYRGYDVFELPPNGQGIAALEQLNILEGYDLKAMGHNSADYLHVHTEAKKLAFENRARLYADEDFFKAPIKTLLSKEYAQQQRQKISMHKAIEKVEWKNPQKLEQGDTIYLTTADKNGMMVSLIQSNYRGMGSGLVPDGLGFMLQDRGQLFSLDKKHANVYAPNKRPFHTIIPAFILKDGKPFLSFGLMGGAMQPQGHAQMVSNIIDFGMNVQEAGDAARYRHGNSSQPTGEIMTDGGVLNLESGIAPAVIEELKKRGHKVNVGKGGFGGYQAIMWDVDLKVYKAASEMRKDGQAAGY